VSLLIVGIVVYDCMMNGRDVSADDILNMIMDEIDDMLVINDAERNVIWANRSVLKRLDMTLEEVVGMKCFRLFGATCCCDKCTAICTMGGPHHCGCKFKAKDLNGELECVPLPRYKDGKLRIVVQHIRTVDKNE
jgi:Transcriptional regulator containing PAS, AAA-type ATPase, and DNA-binding domains